MLEMVLDTKFTILQSFELSKKEKMTNRKNKPVEKKVKKRANSITH